MLKNVSISRQQRILALMIATSGAGVLHPSAQLSAQEELAKAVEGAQQAWVKHRVADLVSASDTVRLHIPGIVPSASLRPGQAARLLQKYLKPTKELSFVLQDVRRLAEDHAYAEVQRVYVVRGTSEQRRETVFLGFRRIGGKWRLREVRVTP